LRDTPVEELGYEPMDGQKLVDAAVSFTKLAEELHVAIHDPTKAPSSLEEARATAEAAVVLGISYSMVNPDYYFEYWRLVSEQGLLLPVAVIEHFQS